MGKIRWRRDRLPIPVFLGFPGGSAGEESACKGGRSGFDPWVGKIPWRKEWLPTPVFLHGKSHAQRSLEGYSPWGCKVSDPTEHIGVPRFCLSRGLCPDCSCDYLMSFRLELKPSFCRKVVSFIFCPLKNYNFQTVKIKILILIPK